MADDDEGDLLVLLLDMHLFYGPAGRGSGGGAGPMQLQPNALLEQVLYFIGVYRLLHDNNQLAVFAVRDKSCDPLCTLVGDQLPGTSFINPYQLVKDGLVALMQQEAASATPPGPAALSGALSRALCLIHRLQATPSAARSPFRPRILYLAASPDVPLQYIPVMNAIFSAQRAGVAVDALVLHASDSGFMQQAAHLTGGLYFRPAHPAGALQYLVQSLSAATHTRQLLSTHQPQGVDFRASCFCHKRAIDVGFVCSVCLAIFCSQLPACCICGTAFGGKRKAAKPTPA